MGSFIGHVLPGSMFLLFGLWWTLRIAQIRYYTTGVCSPRRPPRRRKALPDPTAVRLAFGSHKYPRFPVEAAATIILTTVGIVIEGVQAVGNPPEGGWLAISNTMHVTMYAAFSAAAIAELLMRYRSHLLPIGTDYFMLFLAFTVEAVLFYYHTEHQAPFEQTVHLLLVWTIVACAASVAVESFRPEVLELKRVRAFCTTLQGAWFYTVAFLLYNPFPGTTHPWQPAVEHAATMWVGVIFGWLCFAVAVVHLAICAYVSGCTAPKRQSLYRRYNHNDVAVENGRTPSNPTEKVALDVPIDDSSEVELILAQENGSAQQSISCIYD